MAFARFMTNRATQEVIGKFGVGSHAERSEASISALAKLLVMLVLFVSCTPKAIDREHWLAMSPADRVLTVRTLLGAEKVKQAKGGNDRTYSRSPEEYAKEIDAAYARGDQRTVDEIFAGLADRR